MPAFFDVLHYCSNIKLSFDKVKYLLEKNVGVIFTLLQVSNVNITEVIDEIFYDFIMFYKELGDYWGDLCFLQDKLIKQYNKSYLLLCEMGIINETQF